MWVIFSMLCAGAAFSILAPLRNAPTKKGRAILMAAVIFVPFITAAIYVTIGSPDLSAPRSALVIDEETAALTAVIWRFEAHLLENPDDVRQWRMLGRLYMELGRSRQAARAFQAAGRLTGPDAENDTDLALALVQGNNGIVNDAALALLERAAAASPQAVAPRYFIALALAQEGRMEAALEKFRILLEDPAVHEELRQDIRARITRLENEARDQT